MYPLPLSLPAGVTTLSLRCHNSYTSAMGPSPAGLLAALVAAKGGAVLAASGAEWAVAVGKPPAEHPQVAPRRE